MDFMKESKKKGQKQKKLLENYKGPTNEMQPGKMKAQFQKGKTVKAQKKPTNRTNKLIGKRSGVFQKNSQQVSQTKRKKVENKNGPPKEMPPKEAVDIEEKEEKVKQEQKEEYTHNNQFSQTHLLTKQKKIQTDVNVSEEVVDPSTPKKNPQTMQDNEVSSLL